LGTLPVSSGEASGLNATGSECRCACTPVCACALLCRGSVATFAAALTGTPSLSAEYAVMLTAATGSRRRLGAGGSGLESWVCIPDGEVDLAAAPRTKEDEKEVEVAVDVSTEEGEVAEGDANEEEEEGEHSPAEALTLRDSAVMRFDVDGPMVLKERGLSALDDLPVLPVSVGVADENADVEKEEEEEEESSDEGAAEKTSSEEMERDECGERVRPGEWGERGEASLSDKLLPSCCASDTACLEKWMLRCRPSALPNEEDDGERMATLVRQRLDVGRLTRPTTLLCPPRRPYSCRRFCGTVDGSDNASGEVADLCVCEWGYTNHHQGSKMASR
jgi:hypothetical protein